MHRMWIYGVSSCHKSLDISICGSLAMIEVIAMVTRVVCVASGASGGEEQCGGDAGGRGHSSLQLLLSR